MTTTTLIAAPTRSAKPHDTSTVARSLPAPTCILGVPVHPLRMAEVVELVRESITDRARLLIGVVNAAKLVHMQADAALRDSVLSADVVLADGMAVVWAARILGHPLPERVTGIDLMTRILELADKHRFRIFCLGATQEILDQTVARIQSQYPHASIAGAQHGYYTIEQEAEVAARIQRSDADVLLVAMTSPKKEQFLGRWSQKMQVPVCHGVGGAFDVFAGKVRRAPQVWQRLGLEWLYRVVQEPGRLWKRYAITNTVFIWLLMKQVAAQTLGRSNARQ